MSNEVAVLNARNFIRQGGKFGNYTATTYELNGDRVVLVAECNECGAKNRIQWSNVSSEQRMPGVLPCINRAQHRPASKQAAIEWRNMSDAKFRVFVNKLSSDDYLRLARSSPDFESRDKATEIKRLDYKAAISAKEEHDKEARIGPLRALYRRLYFVCMGKYAMPVNSLEEFVALKPAQRDQIVQQFNLHEDDGLLVRF